MSEQEPTDYNKFIAADLGGGGKVTISADEFGNKFKSFDEIYYWLLYDAKKWLPPKANLRLRYLKDVLRGDKL